MSNASDILSLDYKFVAGNRVYTITDIENAKQFYKAALFKTFNGETVGKTVYLWTNELFAIVSALKASWELGCTIFAADYNPYYNQIPEFKNFHDFIDVVIGHGADHVNNSLGVLSHKPHIIIEDVNLNTDYAVVDYALDKPIGPDTNAVTTHTSGTTGFPKLKYFTHQLVIDIAKSEVEMNRMEPSDVGGHVKTLHHGSLFLNYAIPLLSICTEHHCLHNMFHSIAFEPEKCLKVLLEYVDRNNLTRLMIPYNWIRYMPNLPEDIDLKKRVTLNSILGPTDAEMRDIFKRFKPRRIINMWGCSEVGSVFHSITNDTNLDAYNPNKFEVINKDIDYVVETDHILLKWKTSNIWHKIGDVFKVFPDHLLWLGRSATITLDGTTVNVGLIKEFLEKKYNTVHFSIVIDYELNQLYLAKWDRSIPSDITVLNDLLVEQFGQEYRFSRVKQLNYGRVLQGMKPSQPILLYMFRNDEQAS